MTNYIGRSALFLAMTRGFAANRADAQPLYSSVMQLPDRDHQVLVMVSRFNQLSTPQINKLVFHNVTTRIPCDRAIKRLVNAGLLELVEQPQSGGRRGGRSVSVYQLGRNGWSLFYTGRRKASTVVRHHALAVADVFVQLKDAERAGLLDILEWQIESDAYVTIDGAELHPDAFFDIVVTSQSYEEIQDDGSVKVKAPRRPIFVEVDLGTERQRHIIDKLERYKYAYDRAGADEGDDSDDFPQVVFLAFNDERGRELERIVGRQKYLPNDLIKVHMLADFPALLL